MDIGRYCIQCDSLLVLEEMDILVHQFTSRDFMRYSFLFHFSHKLHKNFKYYLKYCILPQLSNHNFVCVCYMYIFMFVNPCIQVHIHLCS